MDDVISRKAAIEMCREPRMRNADCSDFEMEIMMLPSAQPKSANELAEKVQNAPNDDFISRKAAIDAFDNLEWFHQNANKDMVSGANPEHHQAWYKEQDIYKALEQLPSAQQRWIPCSERLPEKDGDYLTTLTDKDGNYADVTEWQNIIGGRWVAPLDECDYCEIGNVVAWMPLPEPYHRP